MFKIIVRLNRWFYVSGMMKAIKQAQYNVWNKDKPASKTNGLRVIRRFEKINQIEFDPYDNFHVKTISGHGTDEAHFRRVKLLRGKQT